MLSQLPHLLGLASLPTSPAQLLAVWQPVNGLLASDNPQVITEQFGDIYATVFNLSDKPQTVRLKVLPPSVATLEELVAESTQTVSAGVLTLTLPPETVRVFRFK